MPTYEYRCEECGLKFDKTVRVAQRNCVACPSCDGITERLFTLSISIVIPGHFMLDRTWAEPPPGDPAWANMSPAGARGGIHTQRTPSLKDEFEKVKNWG